MRGQYSIEVMLVVAGFFVVISIFAGMYAGLVREEEDLGIKAKLNLEVNRVRNAVNHVYVMGPGNRIEVDVSLDIYWLEVSDGVGGKGIRMGSGKVEVEREAFVGVVGGRIESAEVLVVRNDGEVRIEEKK